MATIYIDRKNIHVKLDGNALAFYANGRREGTAPIGPLSRVVVVGAAVMETPVLHRLADEGIAVLFLSGRRGRFRGRLQGRLHNNGLLRLRQYEKSSGKWGDRWCRSLVAKKVDAQRQLLREAANIRPDLRFDLTRAVNILSGILHKLEKEGLPTDTVRGLEGSGAAHYFGAYTGLFAPSLGFANRNRRPPRDPVNALLSLTYTLLHYELVREIEIIGLDPTIGFYHDFEYGRESLACDLVEIFRPAADRLVWRAFAERALTDRDFTRDGEEQGCYLKKAGRENYYRLYESWAASMRPIFAECVKGLARMIMETESGGSSLNKEKAPPFAVEEKTFNGQNALSD
jgi:CRISPR-associated protein Cas1